jgi:hypothetical protein
MNRPCLLFIVVKMSTTSDEAGGGEWGWKESVMIIGIFGMFLAGLAGIVSYTYRNYSTSIFDGTIEGNQVRYFRGVGSGTHRWDVGDAMHITDGQGHVRIIKDGNRDGIIGNSGRDSYTLENQPTVGFEEGVVKSTTFSPEKVIITLRHPDGREVKETYKLKDSRIDGLDGRIESALADATETYQSFKGTIQERMLMQ